jgi:hypothetical protein
MNERTHLIHSCATLKEATAILKAMRARVGFEHGRVYFDASAARSKRYVCQVSFEDVPNDAVWWPGAMQRPITPDGMRRSLQLVCEPGRETADARR